MLKRKIAAKIEDCLRSGAQKALIIEGAKGVGKTCVIRETGRRLFRNFIEVNMEEDKRSDRLFAEVGTAEDFRLVLSAVAGERMKGREETLVFIDEIQAYPRLLPLLESLAADSRFTCVASGSGLRDALLRNQSIPGGSIERVHMYPLDFEEFLWANGVGAFAIGAIRDGFFRRKALPEAIHAKTLDLFRKYLLVGGLPKSVDIFVSEMNIARVREAQEEIRALYREDAAGYSKEGRRKLKTRRLYDMIPSFLGKRKKRVVAQAIEGKKGARMAWYKDELDYLASSGVALPVKAASEPGFPLVEHAGKNLQKLYLNDVGLFTGILYGRDIMPVLRDEKSSALGSAYETAVAQELTAHGFRPCYYDNKQYGEAEFLVDNCDSQGVIALEVRSGKDYRIRSVFGHSGCGIREAFVLSNERRIFTEGGVTHVPIYDVMFLGEGMKFR
ncbi:MAG: AAA family ATPase [Sutterellaceae bacterium]|nr:AAA family ATPase [Sutterellaceae bacterium]MDD7441240.1 AAA family ATPase [Sutterellaceae bacterium]MDY2869240.1 AAA family ATPase [Mesosutterella sp.]